MITTIPKASFYRKVRESFFNGKLSQGQVDGMEAILNEWDHRGLHDRRQLAYMLATTYHETAKTMQPIEEFGKGRGRRYGQKIKMSGKAYTKPDQIYYGRGFVQLTWYENYELMGNLLGVDLLNRPALALDKTVATQILFEGMLTAASAKGDFTGRCLEMYFNDTEEDWVGARKIINGKDQAEKIAAYGKRFLEALA